jgi:lysyl-tRNA synthetase class 1
MADIWTGRKHRALHVSEAARGEAALLRRDSEGGRRLYRSVEAISLERDGRSAEAGKPHLAPSPRPSACRNLSGELLLNLVSASNASDRDILWGFIRAYAPDANAQANPGLDRLVGYALKYYDDFVKPQKRYRAATEKERAALEALATALDAMAGERNPETVQNAVYAIGKSFEFEPLRDWFKALYEVLFGQTQGPRFGSFAALFGCAETASLIRRALAGEFLAGENPA